MIDPLVQASFVVLLALLFGTAAIPKLSHLDTFEGVVQNYQILPQALVRPAAYGLPIAEIAVAIGLLLPATRLSAALVGLALLAVFAAAVAINVRRRRTSIDCGCFSSTLRQSISWWIVVRNLILMVPAALLAFPSTGRPLGLADVAIAVVAGATLLVLSLAVSLVTLKPPASYEDNYKASLKRG